jgi:hypothetical protein
MGHRSFPIRHRSPTKGYGRLRDDSLLDPHVDVDRRRLCSPTCRSLLRDDEQESGGSSSEQDQAYGSENLGLLIGGLVSYGGGEDSWQTYSSYSL